MIVVFYILRAITLLDHVYFFVADVFMINWNQL